MSTFSGGLSAQSSGRFAHFGTGLVGRPVILRPDESVLTRLTAIARSQGGVWADSTYRCGPEETSDRAGGRRPGSAPAHRAAASAAAEPRAAASARLSGRCQRCKRVRVLADLAGLAVATGLQSPRPCRRRIERDGLPDRYLRRRAVEQPSNHPLRRFVLSVIPRDMQDHLNETAVEFGGTIHATDWTDMKPDRLVTLTIAGKEPHDRGMSHGIPARAHAKRLAQDVANSAILRVRVVACVWTRRAASRVPARTYMGEKLA
jgi:hypothetical protein